VQLIRALISLCGLMLVSVTAVSAAFFGRSTQEQGPPALDVASLLADAGYKYVYVDVRQGLWRIPALSYPAKNLKKLEVFLEPNPHNKSLRVSLPVGFHYNSEEDTEFKKKLNDLKTQFEPTEFVLSGSVLFAVMELPANELDKDALVRGIEKVADQADRAYPQLTEFISLDARESTGPGMGMGIGPGYREPNPSVSNTPSQSNVASNVDSKPVLLNNPLPNYTEEARRNKVQGVVVLRLLVDETGSVKNMRIVRGLPDGLNEKAIEAGHKLRFKPAMKDGKAVSYSTLVEMTFKLY
jgi:TonB family protein